MSQETNTNATLTRRAALKSAAAPDADLIRLCDAYDQLTKAWQALWRDATRIENDDERAVALAPLDKQRDIIAHQICATPARTLDGIRAKARSLVLYTPWLLFGPDPDVDDAFLRSISRPDGRE